MATGKIVMRIDMRRWMLPVVYVAAVLDWQWLLNKCFRKTLVFEGMRDE